MKTISAGIIIDCPSGILMCHGNEKPRTEGNWDIPKGHVEPNETEYGAMVRELREETGLDFNALKRKSIHFEAIGRCEYTSYKDLYLFYMKLTEDIDLSKLSCNSTFESRYTGKQVPEVDEYVLSTNYNLLYKSLRTIVSNCIRYFHLI